MVLLKKNIDFKMYVFLWQYLPMPLFNLLINSVIHKIYFPITLISMPDVIEKAKKPVLHSPIRIIILIFADGGSLPAASMPQISNSFYYMQKRNPALYESLDSHLWLIPLINLGCCREEGCQQFGTAFVCYEKVCLWGSRSVLFFLIYS